MRRSMCLLILMTLAGAAACGSVSSAKPDADPGSDGQGPASCEFAKSGTACAFPPHVPPTAMRTCFTASAPLTLAPPVGATVTFRKNGTTYQLDCSPSCGGATTTIASQEALFQMNAPLVELFCFDSVNIPGGVTVRADPSFDRAISILAKGAISIGGTVDLSGAEAMDLLGGPGGPGGYAGGGRVAPYNGSGPCGGVGGSPQGGAANTGGGGGGGGHAGAGGSGGAGNPSPAGGGGGCARGYVKLEGGSGGGGGGTGIVIANGGTNFGSNFAGSGGGGAIAIVSRTSVSITGSILANGAQGHIRTNNSSFNYNALGGTGGGAGGMIVVAAAAVDVAGSLQVNGGSGRVAWGSGGAGAQGANLSGGAGGNGPSSTNGGAGAGGAGGYIRIFSFSGLSECSSIASPTVSCANSRFPEMPATP